MAWHKGARCLTPSISKRQKIGENPTSIGLFLAGLFVFLGLVIHGVLITPIAVGGPIIEILI
ncbi:MAG: hypothetical protein ABIH76_08605, partial [Candidatus Bathyarchaeota archaeon]